MFLRAKACLLHSLLPAFPMLCVVFAAWGPAQAQVGEWAQYRHPELGFSLRYPSGVFSPSLTAKVTNGQLFVTPDGRARLIVGAFPNDTNMALSEYRQFVLRETYPNSDIDYSPIRKRWFVLSGTMGDKTFYQRVAFTCGGRLINSWAMVYPTSRKQFFDRIVEAVHKTFVPVRRAAACAQAEKLQQQ